MILQNLYHLLYQWLLYHIIIDIFRWIYIFWDNRIFIEDFVFNSCIANVWFLVILNKQVVWLPVRMTLLQNLVGTSTIHALFDYQSEWHYSKTDDGKAIGKTSFDYQSEWHYSKTNPKTLATNYLFDYQSEWHYSKTTSVRSKSAASFDYQSEWHYSKTDFCRAADTYEFDYQSEWHYSKTESIQQDSFYGLITSQNDTTPKLSVVYSP